MMLEILTRHLSTRPTMLSRNQASLAALTGDDWVQTLLIDDVGRGVAWANEQLRDFTPTDNYVWILDDDDECIFPGLIEGLAAIVAEKQPDGVMVRMDHGPLGILPSNQGWGGVLWQGGVGCSALISSRALWMECRSAWGSHYAGDFDYVQAVQQSGARLFWWDVVASRVSRRSMGAGE